MVGDELAGFVSLTPRGPCYSIAAYFAADTLRFRRDEGLFEIRLLTVAARRRGWRLAPLLMYAALVLPDARRAGIDGRAGTGVRVGREPGGGQI